MSVFNPELREYRESNFEANKFSYDVERKLQKALDQNKEVFPDIIQCPNRSCGCPVRVEMKTDLIRISCGSCGWERIIKRGGRDVLIGDGDLAGKGVYAARDFKKGEIVIQYNLTLLSQEEYEALPESEKMFTHSHWGEIYLYDEPERYVNHSKNPNTHPDLKNKTDVAIRDIAKGEIVTTEATLDDIE